MCFSKGKHKIKNILIIAIIITILLSPLFNINKKEPSSKRIFPVTEAVATDETIISINPLNQNVKSYENFTISINITPSEPISSIFLNITFNPTLIKVNDVTQGNFFPGDPNDDTDYCFDVDNINNSEGLINNINWFNITGEPQEEPGIFANISFTAKDSTGESDVDITDIVIDTTPIDISNGTVAVESTSNGEKNNPPSVYNEIPSDKSKKVSLNLSSLKINVEDIEGDPFDWSIETNPDIGNNFDSGKNGVKKCSISNLEESTTYTWYVNITDQTTGDETKKVYNFTTENVSQTEDNVSDNEAPVADAGGPYNAKVGEQINFNASVTNGTPPYEWRWNFGDKNVTGKEITHSYISAAEYNVTVNVTDSNDNSDEAYTMVDVYSNDNDSENSGVNDSEDQDKENFVEESNDGSKVFLFFVFIGLVVIVGLIGLILIIRR